MSEIFEVMKKLYEEGFQGVTAKLREFKKRRILFTFLRNLFTFMVIFQGVIFYSLYQVLETQRLSLSDFTVLFSAMVTVAWIVIGTSEAVVKSYQDSLYIANLKAFLEYEPILDEKQTGRMPRECRREAQGEEMLSFEKVSFTYRGQKKPVLKNIRMTLHQGEKIAIVGHNGAGKSTFVKLLLRLYDVSEGEILYYGRNIRELDVPGYRGIYGTAFQDYQVFSMTVAENVLMRKPESREDYRKVEESLKKSGVYEKIESLPALWTLWRNTGFMRVSWNPARTKP